MELFLVEAVRGIAGGMTSGATYLSTVVGSSVPPGIAAARTALGRIPVGRSPPGSHSLAPGMAPAFSNWRLVSMTSPPWLSGHTNLVGMCKPHAQSCYHWAYNLSRQLRLV